MATIPTIRPAWYRDEDDTAWEKVKASFRRDWQQTKYDFGGKEPNLNQQAGDTTSQAVGAKSIPPGNVPTPQQALPAKYDESDEPAYRYGYAASRQYGARHDWDEQTEALLRKDWGDDSEWERRREAVRRGFAYGKLQRRITTR